MNIYKNTIIYVLCPYKIKTGGTELLHQLVYHLNKNGRTAKIVYVGSNDKLIPEITVGFEIYIDKAFHINEINDYEHNVLVIPEILIFNFKNKFNNLQKIIWWLSVDNFVKNNGFINHLNFWGMLKTIGHTIKGLYPIYPIKDISNLAEIHLCQSYYSIDFLKKSGVEEKKIKYLSDYINDIYFLENNSQISRENIVLYNPKKGYNFTKKLIDASPDIKWIPLINLTTEEVQEMLRKAKVYVDFGNHPGKDRFPREAAISECCIITGENGAARFYEDVMIPNKYKFKCEEKNIKIITEQIRECLSNYNECMKDYQNYREMITNEKNIFIKDVLNIFTE